MTIDKRKQTMETENNEQMTRDNEPEIVSETGNETPQENDSANGIHTVKVSEMESTSSITDDGCFYYVDGNGESKKVSPSTIATYVASRTTTTSTGSLVPDWSQAISIGSVYAQDIDISPTTIQNVCHIYLSLQQKQVCFSIRRHKFE